MTVRSWIALLLLCGSLPLIGCARWNSAPALPSRNSIVLDQLVVFSDSPLPQHHRLLEELKLQRTVLSTKLGLKISDEPIHVYLFPTSDKLEAFLRVHYPALPNRRAFFVETDTRLNVYAYWGDRVAEDLRHEVAHGYLHSIVPQLPLWLDEGLAEYFEVPRGQDGLNRPHLDELADSLARNWRPDLDRLERMRVSGEMTQMEYAESWAWVYFMLESSPERKSLLEAYLQGLGKSPAPPSLAEQLRRLDPQVQQKFVDYVLTLHRSLQ